MSSLKTQGSSFLLVHGRERKLNLTASMSTLAIEPGTFSDIDFTQVGQSGNQVFSEPTVVSSGSHKLPTVQQTSCVSYKTV